MDDHVEPIKIITAKKVNGNVLVQFSDGCSVLFRSRSLYTARNHTGNVVISQDQAQTAMNPKSSTATDRTIFGIPVLGFVS